MTAALKKPVENAPASRGHESRAPQYATPKQEQIFRNLLEKRKEVMKALAK